MMPNPIRVQEQDVIEPQDVLRFCQSHFVLEIRAFKFALRGSIHLDNECDYYAKSILGLPAWVQGKPYQKVFRLTTKPLNIPDKIHSGFLDDLSR